MTAAFWWILLLAFGLILGNLWMLKRSKRLDEQAKAKFRRKKATGAGVTATAVAASPTDSSRLTQVAPDQHKTTELYSAESDNSAPTEHSQGTEGASGSDSSDGSDGGSGY
jgi:hypothetical protein